MIPGVACTVGWIFPMHLLMDGLSLSTVSLKAIRPDFVLPLG